MKTSADQEKIQQRRINLGAQCSQIGNAITGLSDEVGELNATYKRWVEYGQPLDTVNLIEEAGDCLWRLAQLMDAIGSNLEIAMEGNIRKLKVRYPDKYNDELAAEAQRDRKAEADAVMQFLDEETGRSNNPHQAWADHGDVP